MTSRTWLLLLPATLFLLLGFVLPIALLAATSLGGVGGGLGLEQYRRFLTTFLAVWVLHRTVGLGGFFR